MPKAIPDDTHENKRRKDSKFKKIQNSGFESNSVPTCLIFPALFFTNLFITNLLHTVHNIPHTAFPIAIALS
jgi:hypothetical protein